MAARQPRPGPEPHEALQAFAPYAQLRSESLRAVVRRSLIYATPDLAAREIVIDRRAVLLAVLESGLSKTGEHGTVANWLVEWLTPRVGSISNVLAKAATNTTPAPGSAVIASGSIRGTVLPRAIDIANRTVRRKSLDLRHVVIALLMTTTDVEWRDFGWRPTPSELSEFYGHFLARLAERRERYESLKVWREILGGVSAEAPPQPVATWLSGFTADRPAAAGDSDPLAIQRDVEAFAKLVAFSGTQTPLSIGVFGGWGSGKSTFMERLEDEIAELAARAGASHDGDRMLRRIVQVRFNAWHFADANLWASLTAEFFDQLRCGGHDKQGAAIHAELVERVNAHVHDLSAAASQTRAEAMAGDQKLVEAQRERDRVVGEAKGAVSQTWVDVLGRTYEAHKTEIASIVGAGGGDTGKNLDALVDAVKDAPSLAGKFKIFQRTAVQRPGRTWVWSGVIIIGALLGVGGTFAFQAQVREFVGAAGVLAFVGGAWALVEPAYKLIRIVASGVAGLDHDLQAGEADALKKVLTAETDLKAAAAEASARHAAGDRASRALSRYVDPTAPGNPPRLLRYMLDDDPDTQAMEKEVGLIGRARRLFEAVDRIVEEERNKGDKADADTPERIVLYIDDLDRCTYEQVYNVLQAVHLLLAFKLFVVVVAVDVSWIAEALASQFGRRLDGGQDANADLAAQAASRLRAISYLEKIFQLPFWIRPLTSGGSGEDVYGAFVRELLKAQPDQRLADIRTEAGETLGSIVLEPESGGGGGSGATPRPAEPEAEAEPEADILRTLQFDEPERDFLASPAIAGIAATTPRGVVRMANIYRIARLRLGEVAPAKGEPPIWPLLGLFAAVETGGDAELADKLYEALQQLAPRDRFDPEIPARGRAAALYRVLKAKPALARAIGATVQAQGGAGLLASQCLTAARAVRRYSFNKF